MGFTKPVAKPTSRIQSKITKQPQLKAAAARAPGSAVSKGMISKVSSAEFEAQQEENAQLTAKVSVYDTIV